MEVRRRHRRRAHQQPRSRRRQIAQRSAPQPRALDRAPIDRDLTSPAPLSFPATKYASRRSTANGSPVAPIAPPPALADGAAKTKVASSDNASTPATADTPAAQVKRSVTPPARTRDLLAISLALGFASRRLTFARADAPNGRYEGAPYPEVTAGLTAFPLGLVTNGAFRNLGLALRYSQDVSASSKTGNASKDLATGSRELLIDLTLRWTFHLGRTPVHFRGAVGWGMRDFTIDENDAITTMKYRFARFSAGVRVPLGTPLLCLGLAADVRTIYSVGDEALLSLGTRTGGATAFAIRPGVSGATKMGIFYFAHFEYLELGATFIGVEQGTAREKSADSESTTQSTDRFMRFWIGGGYAF
ncbi:MAG: hypothetical protein KC503_10745 [Myxococcales bacterium]|nr:hypothetical protein [Myxococcales bacterium]